MFVISTQRCPFCCRLIAIAFFLAKGFIKTGLGNRIAYLIVAAFGKTTLGLTYSLVMAEALLAPMIPSIAARAGGIFLPLAKVLLGNQVKWVCVFQKIHHCAAAGSMSNGSSMVG